MGQAHVTSQIKPEDKGVLACQLYKLCKNHGLKLHLRTCRDWVEKIQTISPWVEHTGIDPARWGVVGQQMASYHKGDPPLITPQDFVIYTAVGAALNPQPPPIPKDAGAQVGDSLYGSDDEEPGDPPPLYPWDSLRRLANRGSGPRPASLQAEREEAEQGSRGKSRSEETGSRGKSRSEGIETLSRRKPPCVKQRYVSILQRSLQGAAEDGVAVDWEEWGAAQKKNKEPGKRGTSDREERGTLDCEKRGSSYRRVRKIFTSTRTTPSSSSESSREHSPEKMYPDLQKEVSEWKEKEKINNLETELLKIKKIEAIRV